MSNPVNFGSGIFLFRHNAKTVFLSFFKNTITKRQNCYVTVFTLFKILFIVYFV
jgi:hypothetical protein